MRVFKVAIIGAGAAGCFCAINIRRNWPEAQIDIFEAGSRPLAKLALTGGGRCNITNTFQDVENIADAYPRGERLMKRALRVFDSRATREWFAGIGVRTEVQENGRVFPRSNDAMEVVSALLREIYDERISIHSRSCIAAIRVVESAENARAYELELQGGDIHYADVVVVTTGGSASGPAFLDSLELELEPSLPSLFSFNLASGQSSPISELAGISVENASVSLAGTKFCAGGPVLFTHWGLSGPAVLKLSSYAAKHFAETAYRGTLLVNWLVMKEEQLRSILNQIAGENPQKMLVNTKIFDLSSKLWGYLVEKSEIRPDARWAEIGSKSLNRLVNTLLHDEYEILGKNRYKEEFVTCGGVSLGNLNLNNLEAKKYPGLFFAGEILDVDAVTGGFNLQAAWSTAYVVSQNLKPDQSCLTSDQS